MPRTVAPHGGSCGARGPRTRFGPGPYVRGWLLAAGPEDLLVLAVDHQVAVVLHGQGRARMTAGARAPQRLRALVDDEVAVGLHEGVDARALRARAPDRRLAVLVENEVAV